jgi:undecaprenyl-diphosphatase
MASAALAIVIVILLWSTRWRWAAVTLSAAFILFIGYSRLYLGVHFPTDIIGGWAAALLWVAAVWAVLRWEHRQVVGDPGHDKAHVQH